MRRGVGGDVVGGIGGCEMKADSWGMVLSEREREREREREKGERECQRWMTEIVCIKRNENITNIH